MSLYRIYQSECAGNAKNCSYPIEAEINSVKELKEAMKYDHTFIKFKNNYRSKNNFISSSTIVMDVDNDHTNTPSEWIQVNGIAKLMPGVKHTIVTSRHHMIEKGNLSARPRFHVLFPIKEITSKDVYEKKLREIYECYPFFDCNALDSARFFFASPAAEVYHFAGMTLIDEYIDKCTAVDFDVELESIKDGKRNVTMHSIALSILKKYGNYKSTYNRYLKHAERCVPSLDDKELGDIWKSALTFYNNTIRKDPNYIEPKELNEQPEIIWENPIPFDEYSLPAFPVDALPKKVRSYCSELAEFTQTPVDMACCAALAVLGIAAGGNNVVYGKQGWEQYLNLYVVLIASPSERKSAIINSFVKMLSEYEEKYNLENSVKISASKTKISCLKSRKRTIEKAFAEGKASQKDIDELNKDLAEAKELEPLKLFVDDATPESLVHIMKNNGGCAGILSAEGGLFDQLRGIYTKNVNIDVYLKGYSADPVRIDRIGRSPDDINEPILSILLAAQPIVLSGLMTNGVFKGRGLTARFLYSMPQSFVGERVWDTKPVSKETESAFKMQLFDMLDDRDVHKNAISLDDEAKVVLEAFAKEIEKGLVNELESIADWAGKIVGNTVRIAGIIARSRVILNMFLEDSGELVVDKATMENAIQIAKYFIGHAKAAHDLMGACDNINDSKYVLKRIKEKGLTEFKSSDIMRLCKKFKTAAMLEPVIATLTDYGYIKLKPSDEFKKNIGRPSSQIYLVNPRILSTC